MITARVTDEFKKVLVDTAKIENRSLSNFIKHALKTYLQEKHDIDASIVEQSIDD